jgi:hypothetical protein
MDHNGTEIIFAERANPFEGHRAGGVGRRARGGRSADRNAVPETNIFVPTLSPHTP